MFNWVKNLFKDKYSCQHEFDNWKAFKIVSSEYGVIIMHQIRTCKKCGYTQLNVQEK